MAWKNMWGYKVKRGRKHHYLGVGMDFEERGVMKVSMIPYVQDIIQNFLEEIGILTIATPAGEHLFLVRNEQGTKLLPEEHAINFHHNVAKLLFISTRARRDIQTAVAFLSTRVKKPDEDDWEKLKRVIKYLNGTKNLKLTLSAVDLSIVK